MIHQKILKPWIPNPIPNSFILIHVPKNILHLQLKLTVNGTIFSWFGCCGFSPVWTKNLTAMINNCSLSSQYIPHLNQIMCKSWGWHWWFLMLVFEIKKDFPFFQLFIKKKKKNYHYCMAVLYHSQKRSQFAAVLWICRKDISIQRFFYATITNLNGIYLTSYITLIL